MATTTKAQTAIDISRLQARQARKESGIGSTTKQVFVSGLTSINETAMATESAIRSIRYGFQTVENQMAHNLMGSRTFSKFDMIGDIMAYGFTAEEASAEYEAQKAVL